MNYITEQDVRNYMTDRSAADNIMLPDVAWTSEEIAYAMRSAARKYNSLPPFAHSVSEDRLPGDTNIFLDAIACALCDAKLPNVMLNDVTYTAGGVQANVQGSLAENLAKLSKSYNDRFERDATLRKKFINVSQAFGVVG